MTNITDTFRSALADRYDIERELGRGGMATVFLARDRKHDRPVAIKVLNPELGAMLGAERFLSEIKVTATLQHPNLLPLFDSGEAGGLLYYVMPYLEGETLRARLQREQQLSIDDAVRIATGIAHALSYAHARNVIHRDLKPENVLLQHGQPVVLDFGIALAMRNAGGTRMTQTGVSVGTPAYMSPEQAAGEKQIDARTDIYALGALLYEMLAGETPHAGPTAQIVIAKVMSGDAPPVTRMRPSVPAHIASAVHKALSRLPADRFANADEFIRAMQTPVDTGDVMVSSGAPATATSTASPKRTVLVTVAMTAIAAVGAWGWLRPARVAHDSFNLEAALPSDAKAHTNGIVAIAPDGRSIVVEASVGGQLVLLHRPIDGDSMRVINGSGRRYTTEKRMVSFLPDGHTLLVGIGETGVSTLLPLDGGTPRPVGWHGSGMIGAHGAALFAVRDSIWFGRDTTAIKLVYVADSAAGKPAITDLRLLPDERYAIGTITRDGRHEIGVLDLQQGVLRSLGLEGQAPHVDGNNVLFFVRDGSDLVAVPFSSRSGAVSSNAIRIAGHIRATPNDQFDFDVSPDGTLVFSQSAVKSSLGEPIIVERTGRIRRLPGPRVLGTFPRVSPDGRRLVLSNTVGFAGGFFFKDLQTGAVDTRISDTQGGRPDWSADGRFVVYPRSITRYVRRPWDGVGNDSVLMASNKAVAELIFTPDGTRAIARRNGRLFFASASRLDSLTPLNSALGSSAPVISPDGRLVAYNVASSEGTDVFVQLIGSDTRASQISVGGGSEPIWSRDGRTVYFRGLEWALAAHLTSSLEVARLDTLFAVPTTVRPAFASVRRMWDMLPDESGFVMLENPPIHGYSIVRGWERMLKGTTR